MKDVNEKHRNFTGKKNLKKKTKTKTKQNKQNTKPIRVSKFNLINSL